MFFSHIIVFVWSFLSAKAESWFGCYFHTYSICAIQQ